MPAEIKRNYSLKGGKKLRRCARKAGYYKVQALRTARNKLRRIQKRNARKAHWRELGTKRNGQPVKGAATT